MTIKVFGKEADEIHEGDIYIASIDSVEGRRVVTLKVNTDMTRKQSFDSIEVFKIIKNHVGSPTADKIWREIKEYIKND